MKKAICKVRVKGGRLEFLIKKGEKDYAEFANITKEIEKKGFMCWYGDVEDENGKETSGLIITFKPS